MVCVLDQGTLVTH
jgi:hypothetical protein